MNKKVYFITLSAILAFFLIIALVVFWFSATALSGICGTLELDGLDKSNDSLVNVLALGVDESESRSDTVILASLNFKTKEISLLSIPRDTRVKVNGRYDKLTHLYSYDPTGQQTLDAVEEITGADVNYMVTINFSGFRNVIDELGGIDLQVPDLGRGGMYYDDPVQDLHIALKAGYQHLDGEQAEGFVRYRKGYANADLGRIETQRYFLQELVNQKLKLKYITKVPAIFNVLEGDVKTNYSCMDILVQLVRIMGVKGDGINSYSLPGESAMASTRYGTLSCFIYDENDTAELVEKYFSK